MACHWPHAVLVLQEGGPATQLVISSSVAANGWPAPQALSSVVAEPVLSPRQWLDLIICPLDQSRASAATWSEGAGSPIPNPTV